MPTCIHCSHDVGWDAKFCPQCGQTNPAEDSVIRDSTSSDPDVFEAIGLDSDRLSIITAIVGAILGLLLGGSYGFGIGGLGGLLLLSAVGAGVGGILGALLPFLLNMAAMGIVFIGFWVGIPVFLFWLINHLWGVGK